MKAQTKHLRISHKGKKKPISMHLNLSPENLPRKTKLNKKWVFRAPQLTLNSSLQYKFFSLLFPLIQLVKQFVSKQLNVLWKSTKPCQDSFPFLKILRNVSAEINRNSKAILFTTDAVYLIKTLHCIHVGVFLGTHTLCFHKIIVFTLHL